MYFGSILERGSLDGFAPRRMNLENLSLNILLSILRPNGAPSGAEFRPSLGNGGGKGLKLETCHIPKIAMKFNILCAITSEPPLLRVLGGSVSSPQRLRK